MAKLSRPTKFTRHFKIAPTVLKGHGAFDPILNADTRLFVDPLLLAASKQPELRQANHTWNQYFRDLVILLQEAQGPGDPAYREALRRLIFPEFKSTCLGYGESIAGGGIGEGLAKNILDTAQRIVQLGVKDPTFFALIPVMEKDLGADRISDMTSRLIEKDLCVYTERVLKAQDIPRTKFSIGGREFQLPKNPFTNDRDGRPLPVLLVPIDVIRNLPIAMDWSEIRAAAAVNAELRAGVSARIAHEFAEQKNKKDRKEFLLSDRERLARIVARLKEKVLQGVDIEKELDGLLHWIELGEQFAQENKATLAMVSRDLAGVKKLVEDILEQFKHAIEKGGWKSLYDDEGDPRHEHIAQLIFFMIAESWCIANDVEVSPETDQGGGPVDFKFSVGYHSRVLVELKWSHNTALKHGYETQLEVYKKGERTDTGFFVVLDTGKGEKQLNAVVAAETAAKNAHEKHSEVFLIDARPKLSASKRPGIHSEKDGDDDAE